MIQNSAFAILIWAVIALTGLPLTPAFAQTLNDPSLRLREVIGGLSNPTSMAFIGLHDILVLQKNDGRVRRVTNGVLQPGEVLDVHVDNDSERGLLGIALHPNFPATVFVYLYYTESSAAADTTGSPLANRVYRYTWDGSSLVSPELIIDLPVTDGPNHDGGVILFGPDEKLYIVIGDLNRNGQLQNFPGGAAPDDTGVILRLNDDGTIPSDNPFFSQGGNLAKYYAYGVRNSFGLAFDPITGKLWDTENGPGSYDEINQVVPGFNSGWEQIMGPNSRDPEDEDDLFAVPGSQYVDPKFSWLNPVGVTAITFLDSPRLGPQYRDDAFVGDINNGRLYRFKLNAPRDGFILASPLDDLVGDNTNELSQLILGSNFGGITDLKVGPDGRLYILSYGLGKIFAVSGPEIPLDFDGDGKSDVAVYQSSSGNWFGLLSTDGFSQQLNFGGPNYLPVPGDYDGDGLEDTAVYNTANGNWFIDQTTAGFLGHPSFGGPGFIPVPGDYDGDGKTDIAVYQTSTGHWFFVGSTAGFANHLNFGGPGFIPVPGDYDGDGETDTAVYQSSSGNWFVVGSTSGFFSPALNFGGSGFIPVPADYDGDGKADPAVYQSSTGHWFFVGSSEGFFPILSFGGTGFTPVPGDYDGDGKTDTAVYENSSGHWFVLGSTFGFFSPALNFGAPGFVPVLPEVTILRAMGVL